jgi:hypothetical protein
MQLQRTDIEENRAVVLLVDSVVAQDLVVESRRGSHGTRHCDGGDVKEKGERERETEERKQDTVGRGRGTEEKR